MFGLEYSDHVLIKSMSRPQTVTTQYDAQLGLQDKDRAIKGLNVCNYRDLEP